MMQPVARKRWMSQQKLRMIEESMQPGTSVSHVACKNGVSPALSLSDAKCLAG